MADEPTEGLHDPTKFVAPEFPWLLAPALADDELADMADMAEVFRLVLTESGNRAGTVVPVFSDEDLANRFAADLPASAGALEAFRSPHRAWMTELLDLLHSQGVTHVGFDPGPGGRLPGPLLPIRQFAAHYRS